MKTHDNTSSLGQFDIVLDKSHSKIIRFAKKITFPIN